ncbi:MAG: MBL fold metallo-hydrolase [bacterium]
MFKKISLSFVLLLFLFIPVNTFALGPGPDTVFVRVVDVGQGLCCVVVMPDNHYMIYDAGPVGCESKLMPMIENYIPSGSAIDLLVLSHTDADHICAVDEICAKYKVKTVLETGDPRPGKKNWQRMVSAIEAEVRNDNCHDINLGDETLMPGSTFRFGDTFVTFVCGFNKPLKEWGSLDSAKKHNSICIVMRLTYKGHSILFTGDTVGRSIGDPPDTCMAAEKYMVEYSESVSIASDVLIAPHHGSDTASSTDFIKEVNPEYVIFSAGRGYEHPHKAAVNRIIGILNLASSKIFRTDLGDNEGTDEWADIHTGEGDSSWDDNVDILLPASGNIQVEYSSS